MLGVISDDALGWEEQFAPVKKKVTGGLSAMEMFKNILPQSMLFQVNKVLIECHIRYTGVVWGNQ